MKFIFAVLMLLAIGSQAHATTDAFTTVYLVVKDVQEDYYRVRGVPVIGCFGPAQGPQLSQFTSKYEVPGNVGCGDGGGTQYVENINALTCAKITSSTESEDYTSYSAITLDISGCEAKDNKQFITMVRTAAAKNFPQSNRKEVQLTLVK